MEETILLLAVQRAVGGIKVEYQLFGCGLEAFDELVYQYFMKFDRDRTRAELLQSTQDRRAGQVVFASDRALVGDITTQVGAIVQVFAALYQPIHPLAQHVADAVGDRGGFARIGNRARRRVGHSQAPIERRQQHHAAVAGHVAAIEVAFNHAPSQVPKFKSR